MSAASDWKERKRIEAERAEHVAKHGGGCEICGTVPKTRGLQWDHDHKTGKHRGWLCHRCNRALPSWVTEEWLRAAASYLHRDKPCTCKPAPSPNASRGIKQDCPRHGYRVMNVA